MLAPGINIWSGCDDPLGAALTNPTEIAFRKGKLSQHFPVVIDGRQYVSAEAAYMDLRTGRKQIDLLVRIMAEKLLQHPALIEQIDERGGIEWLWTCSHWTNAKSPSMAWWEGTGADSAFIWALCKAYRRASEGRGYEEGLSNFGLEL